MISKLVSSWGLKNVAISKIFALVGTFCPHIVGFTQIPHTHTFFNYSTELKSTHFIFNSLGIYTESKVNLK